MLKVENFTKKYGDFTAVDNISFEVNKGEICAFIGHNGAGKSTTIKAIVGALNFNHGEIFVNDISIKSSPIEAKKIMAYIPDNPDIYEYLTGIQYLNFICDIFRVEKDKRNNLISQYSDMFELTKNLNDLISSYSHGMKQKLVIISALIHSPKLLILDEPFVGLDPIATHKLKEIMRNICSEGGAIFFSTHILEVAEKLCDKVIIIKDGKLIKQGDMQEIIKDKSLENIFLELANE